MAGDSRGWYRDWWRKRTGYTERARFRMSEGDIARDRWRAGWRRNFWLAVLVLLLLFVARAVIRA